MSGRWYAKVLLPEPLHASLRKSIEHFAQGTGCMALHWPAEKENRQQPYGGGGKRGPNPPEALLAYGSSEERQAALDENQQRPGEWGFYAAATKGSREAKERKNGRSLQEGEELIGHREPFGELQPPQIGRGGLLGDAPSDWGWTTEPQQQAQQQMDCSFFSQQDVAMYAEQWSQYCPTSPTTTAWSASPNNGNRDEWGMYVDPPVQQEQAQQQQQLQPQPPQQQAHVLQPLGQGLQPQLPPVEDLVRSLDFLDDETEYRSLVTCLPAGLVAAEFQEDELEDMPARQIDFGRSASWGAESTPPRGRRSNTYGSPSPKQGSPVTPGSAAHVAMWRPINHNLPSQHTFIHFATGSSGSRRANSCPPALKNEEDYPTPVRLVRAKTFGAQGLGDPAPLPDGLWADEAILLASDEPMDLAESPVRRRFDMLESAIETPQRHGGSYGEEHTPAPRQGPPRARRGGRGRHGKGLQKLGSHGTWRPSLWQEAGH